MKKQKLALLLTLAMLCQTGTSAAAQEKPVYQEETEPYVVMAENLEVVEEMIGTEIEEDSFQAGTQEVVMLDLTEQEVRELERSDVLIEEDTLFCASAINEVSDMAEQEETERIAETAEKVEEAEAGTEQKTDLEATESAEVDEAAERAETEDDDKRTEQIETGEDVKETEQTEESKEAELTETGESETTEPLETEEESKAAELIEETEATEFSEERNETEPEEGDMTPEKEEAEAIEDWNLAAIHAEAYVKAELQVSALRLRCWIPALIIVRICP